MRGASGNGGSDPPPSAGALHCPGGSAEVEDQDGNTEATEWPVESSGTAALVCVRPTHRLSGPQAASARMAATYRAAEGAA